MKKQTVNFDKSLPKNLPLLLQSRALYSQDYTCQASKNKDGEFVYYTFKQVYNDVIAFACSCRNLGVKRGDLLGIISDNRREWLLSDMAILSLGAVDIPRGCDSLSKELCYILSFCECRIAFFENQRQLIKVLNCIDEVPTLKDVIVYDDVDEETYTLAKQKNITVHLFANLLSQGRQEVKDNPHIKAEIESEMQMTDSEELATIIFTSGTTGTPKGVMLSHRSFLAQMEIMHIVLFVKPGDMWLSVLPVWHSFERVVQYIAITLKSGIAYSKPIAQIMLPDMAKIKPQWMCGVPRLWESLATGVNRSMKKTGGIKYLMYRFFVNIGKKFVWCKTRVCGEVCQIKRRLRLLDFLLCIIPFILLYPLYKLGDVLVFKKIREKMGGNLKSAISGGGALPKDIDAFYRAVGLNLLEGYGMTETAPVISFRDYRKPRPNCVGKILPCLEAKVVQEQNGKIIDSKPLHPGKKGLILVKGEQIMKGYYKQPELSESIIDSDGYLNTGDLGLFTYDEEIKITGRAKDTIVLLGGENVEPQALESTLCESPYIESAVVLGQDEKYLSCLIVPSKDAIISWSNENGIPNELYETMIETSEVKGLIRSEIDKYISAAKGFRMCEKIYNFALLSESFTIGDELSAKQEIKRYKINQKYKKIISGLFKN